jgi:gamma-glutamyltranspeptidase/glutathione hydrolase
VLTVADIAAYEVQVRAPIELGWGTRRVVAMGPPSSGGIALAQLLGVGARSTHCEVEAAKFVMADRALRGGDPAFVPPDLEARLDPARLRAWSEDCGERTFPADHYAPTLVEPPRDDGTLHISVMDGAGWAVALTTTINTAFGSRVVGRQSGILLNNQMDDFATRPGVPNAFGLVQGENNAVAPGKRPLSSMSPTVVLDADGRPEAVVGGSGGPFIITATYQVTRAVLEGGASASRAVAAPRWHHQWMPDAVLLEAGHPDEGALAAAGHALKPVDPFSSVQVVVRRTNGFEAASDPRKFGQAACVLWCAP